LDRDGVICHNRPDHVKSWSEFVFLARARESLARLAVLEMPIIVVTNQAAINRGLVPAEIVDEIHCRMGAQVEASGGRIDRVYYCPHRPDESCGCRKPQPGMLKRAAADLGIQLEGSYIVGDAWTDIQAGLAVGCTPFLVLTGRGWREVPRALRQGTGGLRVARDLSEAVTAILQAEGLTPQQMTWSRPDQRDLPESRTWAFENSSSPTP
jgi:D-glycero-D-manno-heptose 1,7-bisphosphate phosphatase